MIEITNPFNLDFREARGGRLVIYHSRNIARITQDGVMIADGREVNRNALVLETLGCSKAMFLVEQEEHAEAILEWRGVEMFQRLKLDLYFNFPVSWFMGLVRQFAPRLQTVEELEITGAVVISDSEWEEVQTIFPNMTKLRVLGRSFDR